MSTAMLSIGAVADATGVPVSAVRYYDEVGLIASGERVGGKRRFDPAVVGRVNFIRRTQRLGFSLDEIDAILSDDVGGWTHIVDDRLATLRTQAQELDEVISMLESLRSCGCTVVAECPRTGALQ